MQAKCCDTLERFKFEIETLGKHKTLVQLISEHGQTNGIRNCIIINYDLSQLKQFSIKIITPAMFQLIFSRHNLISFSIIPS